MVSVTLELLGDPQRRERLAHEGRKAAVERHNFDRIAEVYEKHCFFVTRAASHE
jgi:hypothetical protein